MNPDVSGMDLPLAWIVPGLLIAALLAGLGAAAAWWCALVGAGSKPSRHRVRWVVACNGGYLSGHRWRWAAGTRNAGHYDVMTVEQFDSEHSREQADLWGAP